MSETETKPEFNATHEHVTGAGENEKVLPLRQQDDGSFIDETTRRYTRAFLDRNGTLRRAVK